ncbi:MAG: hypothetical protein J7L72_05320 [Candidatus Aminicenantes bacterium]|nr:hypothetical protein [Candidatus Aminicenantes bacterium]
MKLIDSIDAGTHMIFIGGIEDAEKLSDGKPMTYEYYHKVKGGFSQKTAPAYWDAVDNEIKKEE